MKSIRLFIIALLSLFVPSAVEALDTDPILEPYVEYSPERKDMIRKNAGEEVEAQNGP